MYFVLYLWYFASPFLALTPLSDTYGILHRLFLALTPLSGGAGERKHLISSLHIQYRFTSSYPSIEESFS